VVLIETGHKSTDNFGFEHEPQGENILGLLERRFCYAGSLIGLEIDKTLGIETDKGPAYARPANLELIGNRIL
jgi:hypothetical protein